MNITDRMLTLAKEKKITQKQIEEYLGIEQPTIAKWKSRGINPPAELIPEIAKLLDVSIEWLMIGYENKGEYLTSQEKYLIKLFRKGNESGRERIIEQAELLSQKYKFM